MAFLAPIIAGVAAFASAAAPIIGAVSGIVGIASALRQPKTAKAPPVVPLPDPAGAATKLRLLNNRLDRDKRQGLGSTLVGGQLGDASGAQQSAPLVYGRV